MVKADRRERGGTEGMKGGEAGKILATHAS